MKKIFSLILGTLLLQGAALVAQDAVTRSLSQPAIRINYNGTERQYELAKDEIVSTNAQGKCQVLWFAAKASADDLRKHAEKEAASSGEKISLVLYEKGAEHNEANRRLLTSQITVKLKPHTDAAAVARDVGAKVVQKMDFAPDIVVLEVAGPGASLAAAERLRARTGVESADAVLAKQQNKRWTPNDTYFSQQWHLNNTGQNGGTAGVDVHCVNVWNTWRGAGIHIGIVDDGLQTAHPDLAPNYDAANSRDWNGNDLNPNPDLNYDDHGTSCAGVAGGRGNNGTGISGAAPEAFLAGLRLIAGATTDSQEADAMTWHNDVIHIKSNSWGPADDGKTLEGPGTITQAALASACSTGRGGLGTIFTWAGGNGGSTSDNSNYDGYANSIYTIAVGAVNDRGVKSYYSEPGANLVVCAPSNDSGRQGITTTDLTGNYGYNDSSTTSDYTDKNYTKTFGGTSSATPLAAGGIALLLQSKPTLGWRDVQEILMKSATKCSPADTDWVANSGGFQFNHKYGAGLINVEAAVNLAKTWTNLGPQTSTTSAQTGLSVLIPDNSTAGITRTFTITDTVRVEHATVKLDIAHPYRGDLAITLTSPTGTVSRLAERHNDRGANWANWTFMTVRNWGEAGKGTWTLNIKDLRAGNTGTLKAATLTLFGSGATGGGGGGGGGGSTTETKTYTSTDVPKSIPDNNVTGVTSVNPVDTANNITALTVSLNINHTYKGDLKVTLTSPAGTSVVLQNRSGGSADNVVINNLALTKFNGQAALGAWKLRVQDLAAIDIGTLTSWSLTITSQPPVLATRIINLPGRK